MIKSKTAELRQPGVERQFKGEQNKNGMGKLKATSTDEDDDEDKRFEVYDSRGAWKRPVF